MAELLVVQVIEIDLLVAAFRRGEGRAQVGPRAQVEALGGFGHRGVALDLREKVRGKRLAAPVLDFVFEADVVVVRIEVEPLGHRNATILKAQRHFAGRVHEAVGFGRRRIEWAFALGIRAVAAHQPALRDVDVPRAAVEQNEGDVGLFQGHWVLCQPHTHDVATETVDPNAHGARLHADQPISLDFRRHRPPWCVRGCGGHFRHLAGRVRHGRSHCRWRGWGVVQRVGRRHRRLGRLRFGSAVVSLPRQHQEIARHDQCDDQNDPLNLGGRHGLRRSAAGGWFGFEVGNRIDAARPPRMAARQPLQRQPAAAPDAVPLNGLHRVRGAAWPIAAAGRQPRAQRHAVEPNRRGDDEPRPPPWGSASAHRAATTVPRPPDAHA